MHQTCNYAGFVLQWTEIKTVATKLSTVILIGHLICMEIYFIGIGPITQYMHMRNKNSNTKGSSPNVVKMIFHTLRNSPLRKEFAPSGGKFFPLSEVPILKRDVIEENHCLIQ